MKRGHMVGDDGGGPVYLRGPGARDFDPFRRFVVCFENPWLQSGRYHGGLVAVASLGEAEVGRRKSDVGNASVPRFQQMLCRGAAGAEIIRKDTVKLALGVGPDARGVLFGQ